jgi:hypothetical protein
MQEINACLDIPDERDFQYELLMWSNEFQKIDFPKITVWNQWLDRKTRMACTRYALWHIVNAQNVINEWVEFLDLYKLWERYLQINPWAESEWATLQSALQQAKNEWLIGWFFQVKTETEINDALAKWLFVYTGSSNWDWSSVRDSKIYKLRTDGKIVGHAWIIPKEETLLNSYWENNGFAKLPKELYGTTFTKYAITPKTKYDLTLIYKNKIMSEIKLESAKKAFELWIWNGLDWNKPVTREEASAMIYRAVEKLSERK